MSKKEYEDTTKGNPYKLTKYQHIQSAHSISKFYNDLGKIELYDLKKCEKRNLTKTAKVFCAKRIWDQNAESGFMVKIEKEYHSELDKLNNFEKRNHISITKYYLLWQYRFIFSFKKNDDIKLNNISGDNFSKLKEEEIESYGAAFTKKDGYISSRFINGVQIQAAIMNKMQALRNITWGLIRLKKHQFLVSDNYVDHLYFPINPEMAYMANIQNCYISENDLRKLNKMSLKLAKNYYFGCCLSDCLVDDYVL